MNEESRYLAFSGLRVHFKVVWPEVPLKNRMLLLSSPLINTFHWRKLLPELSGLGCLAVLVDLPGFGMSDTGAPQGDAMRASLIWGVLDDVDRAAGGPMATWHLCAHGCACATILRMAAMFPDSVKSQVHVCPTFSSGAVLGRGENPARWVDQNIADPRAFRRLIERYSGYPMDDYIIDRMLRPLTRPGARAELAHLLRASASPPKVDMGFCPTMALMGGRDPLADAPRRRQVAQLLRDAEVHNISSAGHFPMETHSRAMRDYLRGWLRYND